MHFSPFRDPAKKMKNDHFWVYFCKTEVMVPFCINFSFILSFNFEKKGNKMNWKMIEK